MSLNGLDDRVKDTAGLSSFIIDGLGTLETEFLDNLITSVAARTGVTDPPPGQQRTLVINKLRDRGIDLRAGGVEDTVLSVLTGTSLESGWAPHVDAFATAGAIPLTFARRALILRALDRLKIQPLADQTLLAQVFDEVTFGAGTDPVQLTRPAGRPNPWDFQVDDFQDDPSQIVLADNVRAAGALMWCYDIGERLGVYKLTDALVYRWWIGLLDFDDTDLVSELYRYYKLRDERPTEEERFLLYRRILDLGDTQVGDRVVVNDAFPGLWRTLMEEIATYIDRVESSFRRRVNRQGVLQAIRELQYNLTERMAGMALVQVTEMYNQLRQTERDTGGLGGLDILGHPEVIAQLGSGRRRDQWSVIERLAKEEFNVSPNVSALRTSAVEGFRVVDFISRFRDGQFDEDEFDAFIESGKAWILSQQLAGDGMAVPADGAEPGHEDEDPGFEDVPPGAEDIWSE